MIDVADLSFEPLAIAAHRVLWRLEVRGCGWTAHDTAECQTRENGREEPCYEDLENCHAATREPERREIRADTGGKSPSQIVFPSFLAALITVGLRHSGTKFEDFHPSIVVSGTPVCRDSSAEPPSIEMI